MPLAIKPIARAWRFHDQHRLLVSIQTMTITTHPALGVLMVLGLLLGRVL